ncbi:transporter [Fervidobacterium thailandense]|uniref:Transporter n=1 Tax=Fervidobacterium thailandense TaxID=1008305 RepID=A0A1E3G2F4_9BACT|nr:transporter [Fervidobacterium thailandense]
MLKSAFNAVLPSFLMIFTGFVYGKVFKNVGIDLFTKVATWLMAPVITYAFVNDYTPEYEILLKFAFGFFLMFVISFVSSKLHPGDREIIFTGNVYVNSGYLGYPVLLALWGEPGLALGVVYSFVNVLFGSTLLPAFISGRLEIRNIFKLPFIYAMAVGWLFGKLGISYRQLPNGVLSYFMWLKEMAIPFLLFQVGLAIARIEFNREDLKTYALVSLERLVVIPMIMFSLTLLMNMSNTLRLNSLESKVFILECAMPIGVNSVVVVSAFKRDAAGKAGISVALSTLLSLLTLPLWAVLLEKVWK